MFLVCAKAITVSKCGRFFTYENDIQGKLMIFGSNTTSQSFLQFKNIIIIFFVYKLKLCSSKQVKLQCF